MMNYEFMIDYLKRRISMTVLLQCLSGFLLLMIVWQWVSDIFLFSHLNRAVKLASVGVKEDLGQSKLDGHRDTKYKLFGEYVPLSLDAATLRQSTLNLTVVGIMFAEDENASQVIFQESSGEQHFFSVGDSLPGGGLIKRITAEGVIVSRHGELERLALPKDELHFDALPKPLVEESR